MADAAATARADAKPAHDPAVQAPTVQVPTGPAAWIRVWSPWLVCIGIALIAYAIQSGLESQGTTSYSIRIAMDVGVAIILAVSLNIVNGFTGQFSIGHAAFFAIGGYAAGFVTYYPSLAIWGTFAKQGGFLGVGEWMMCLGCLAGGLVAAGCGYLVGLPSLRLRGDYLAIVTLGFGEITRVLLQNTSAQFFKADDMKASTLKQWFPPPVGGATGFSDIPKYTNLFWVYLFAAITVVFCYRLKQSSTGRAMIAVREDEIAAQAMGVNITRMKVRAFVIAAFFAGIAGGLEAHQNGIMLQPTAAGFQRSFEIVIMVVLGGLGSISGTVLAAIILITLPSLSFMQAMSEYKMIVYALVLILLMIFRPKGLFGIREIWDYFGPRSHDTKGGRA